MDTIDSPELMVVLDLLLHLLDGGPGGSEGAAPGGGSDGQRGVPASLESASTGTIAGPRPVSPRQVRLVGSASRPRRMALRSSSSMGRLRRWKALSYSRRSFSACSCSLRTSRCRVCVFLSRNNSLSI
eukprot:scaffold57222_cov51-Phaeocystis_antarctica.AAC.4